MLCIFREYFVALQLRLIRRKKRFEQTKPESTEAELTHTNVECQSTDKYVRDIFAEQKLSHWRFSSLRIVKEA